MVGSQDRGVLNARLRRNNPNVRQQRRANKKPRKQLPTAQPPQGPKVTQPVDGRQNLTLNESLDARVERMRQPSTGGPAFVPQTEEAQPNPYASLPTIFDFDPKTRAMFIASVIREMENNPELMNEDW